MKNFKTYDELKEKLERVLGLTTGVETAAAFNPTVDVSSPPFDGGKPIKKQEETAETETSEEYSYFAKLADQE